jgi:hypothetical protein
VDGVERYGDAGDLNRTVISVMRQLGVQSGELLPWINTFEPNESLNPRDHPDHLDVFYFVNGFGSSGRSGSVTAGAHWAFFRGDSVLNEPANLTREQHEQKAAVFGAYYFAVVDAYGAGATEMCAAPGNEADYAAVLWRQYLTAEVE